MNRFARVYAVNVCLGFPVVIVWVVLFRSDRRVAAFRLSLPFRLSGTVVALRPPTGS